MKSLKTLSVNAVQVAITSRLLNSIIQQASEQTVVITEKAMVSAKDALTNKYPKLLLITTVISKKLMKGLIFYVKN